MYFQPEFYSKDLASLTSRFVAIVGWGVWQKRIRILTQKCKSPIFEDRVKERHALELELGQLRQRERSTGRLPKKSETNEFQRLAGLMRMVVGIYSRLGDKGKVRLRGMLLDALKSDGAFISLEHEMVIASHLMRQGFEVDFVDLEGIERFDFLARREQIEIEIECKTVSYDQGRKIHRNDFLNLATRLWPIFKDFVENNRSSLFVTLSLSERLEPNDENLENICKSAKSVLNKDQEHAEGVGFCIDVDVYNPRILPPDLELLRDEVEERLHTHQFHLFLCGNSFAAVVFVARSFRPDRVLTYMYRQLKNASDQFTSNRPAILCTYIEDIYPHQWLELGQRSGLENMTYRYLRSPKRSHVHTVGYNSAGTLERYVGYAATQNTVLYYRNRKHPLYEDPSLNIFAG